MSKVKSEKPLVYGSIRAEKNDLFYEPGKVKELNMTYSDTDFKMNPAFLTEEIKTYFGIAEPKMTWDHGDRPEPKLTGQIAGIDLISIDYEDKDHIRLKFSARSISQFEGKTDKIIAWLDSNDIDHGEKNGKKVCVFACLDNIEKDLKQFFKID